MTGPTRICIYIFIAIFSPQVAAFTYPVDKMGTSTFHLNVCGINRSLGAQHASKQKKFFLPKRRYTASTDINNKQSKTTLFSKVPTLQLLEQQNIVTMDHKVLSGHLFPFISRLAVTPTVWKAIRANADMKELGLLLLGGSGFLSIVVRGIQQICFSLQRKPTPRNVWKTSKIYHLMNHIEQGFRIGVAVYFIDLVADVLVAAGFQNSVTMNMSSVSATVMYTIWAMFRVLFYKSFLLHKMFEKFTASKSVQSDWKRTYNFYNRLLDYLIYVMTIFLVVDMLGLNLGKSIQTLCAFGGVGTFVAGYASKDLALQAISGLSLSLGNSFQVGDRIRCGDGTTGVVETMQLLNTIIRGPDELLTKIPNSKLASQRISNLSLLSKSRVEQTLTLRYDSTSSNLEDIPHLLSMMKQKVKERCPKVITNGRPFDIHWVGFKSNIIEIYVDCRFDIPPDSEEYRQNRQNLFLALHEAIKLLGFDYAK